MPSRSFDPVPQLVQPKYRNMDKMMSDAHATWDRMAANMAPRDVQANAAAPLMAEPYIQPADIQRQAESSEDAVLTGAFTGILIAWQISWWRQRRRAAS